MQHCEVSVCDCSPNIVNDIAKQSYLRNVITSIDHDGFVIDQPNVSSLPILSNFPNLMTLIYLLSDPPDTLIFSHPLIYLKKLQLMTIYTATAEDYAGILSNTPNLESFIFLGSKTLETFRVLHSKNICFKKLKSLDWQ